MPQISLHTLKTTISELIICLHERSLLLVQTAGHPPPFPQLVNYVFFIWPGLHPSQFTCYLKMMRTEVLQSIGMLKLLHVPASLPICSEGLSPTVVPNLDEESEHELIGERSNLFLFQG